MKDGAHLSKTLCNSWPKNSEKTDAIEKLKLRLQRQNEQAQQKTKKH